MIIAVTTMIIIMGINNNIYTIIIVIIIVISKTLGLYITDIYNCLKTKTCFEPATKEPDFIFVCNMNFILFIVHAHVHVHAAYVHWKSILLFALLSYCPDGLYL